MTLRAGIDFYLAKPKAPPRTRAYPARYPRLDDKPLPVHDGDTAWLEWNTGRRNMALVDNRFYNVFAPELTQDGGPDCRQFVVDWLAHQAAATKTLWPFMVDAVLDANGHEIETLGRTVVIVRNSAGTAILNDDMSSYIDLHGYPRGKGA